MSERWEDIPGLAGWYEVSSEGRVRSLDRIKHHARYGRMVLKGRELSPKKNHDGYWRVRVGPYHKFVHVLMLEAFVGPRPDGMQACHNNGINDDNRLENLRWDTPKANVGDRKKHGTYQYGERNPIAKLTEEAVLEILSSQERNRDIAKRFGVHETTICNLRKGRSWRKAAP